MSLLDQIREHEHEQVSFFYDHAQKVTCIIAIHSTVIGPSLGGCRMRKYATLDDALFDVLRLSEAMTYKNSLCGIKHGGGKSVIIADHHLSDGRDELFRTFGTWVDSLGGRYITAEDMGTSVADMSRISKACPHVAGTDPDRGGGGDPSPFTAHGVFAGMQACAERVFGSKDLTKKKIAIQGVGHVGMHLTEILRGAGADLIVSDTNEEALRTARDKFGAAVAGVNDIIATECDIFSPCAVGGTINADSVGRLRCRVVAGAANNQILGEGVEEKLRERNIAYAPDFAINAGGVILCADEFEEGGYTYTRVMQRVSRIYHTVGKILDEAKSTGALTGAVAVRLARERIERERGTKGA